MALERAPYVWGALRRIEARIGELLGLAKVGRPSRANSLMGHLDGHVRSDFRQVAALVRRGLLKYDEGGAESPWRSSRRGLRLW